MDAASSPARRMSPASMYTARAEDALDLARRCNGSRELSAFRQIAETWKMLADQAEAASAHPALD
jgi:hypothetical protein